ncbi:biotin/lipoyl-binding protein [Aquihabitans sp. G128]|uniref:efflux RND transporter periplasmic adaptor subunit n=1 Tax=Aquihabitans sp. G128 TaxID=2849779 RepID=UPI001C21D66B|nr:biotin/lipoyl-binding protein [Aquihabitans sp. G128]QXC61030.1 biotin/lipoyl-binding protein [Aquihabitans sp. G128]
MGSLRRKVLQPWVIMPLAALLAVGGWYLFRPKDDAAADGTATAATEQLVAATSGSMAQTVSAEGTIAAAKTDDLSFSSSGTVTAVKVAAGDTVKAGQVLATIDSAELQAAVTDAEATVADAEATLSDDTDAGATDAQLEADQSTLTSAQDQLATAQEALDGASLVATFDGTVAAVNITDGEELASGGSGGTATTGSGSGSGQSASTLGSSSSQGAGAGSGSTDTTSTAQIQVVSADAFTVDLSFDDTEIADLKAGQVAGITLSTSTTTSTNGFPGGGFPGGFQRQQATPTTAAGATTTTTTPVTADESDVKGIVTEVGKVADASSGVASYPVTVAFSDTTGDFHAGATATVAITYAEVADAIQVPTRAVTTADGTSTVTVDADGTVGGTTEVRTVTIGLTAGGMVQITSGLKAGEQVVLALGGPGRTAATGGTGGTGGTGIGGGGFTPPAGFTPPDGATAGAQQGTGS